MSITTQPRRLLLVADRPAAAGEAAPPLRRFRLARVQAAGQPAPTAPRAKRI